MKFARILKHLEFNLIFSRVGLVWARPYPCPNEARSKSKNLSRCAPPTAAPSAAFASNFVARVRSDGRRRQPRASIRFHWGVPAAAASPSLHCGLSPPISSSVVYAVTCVADFDGGGEGGDLLIGSVINSILGRRTQQLQNLPLHRHLQRPHPLRPGRRGGRLRLPPACPAPPTAPSAVAHTSSPIHFRPGLHHFRATAFPSGDAIRVGIPLS